MSDKRIFRRVLCLLLPCILCIQPVLAATASLPTDNMENSGVFASADSSVITAGDVGGTTITWSGTLNTSESGIALIKELEGFSATAYWDYSQYSIGYGTACDAEDYPYGITETEADLLLREVLAVYESYLDSFLSSNGITLSQQQYDALVSLTYNTGKGWMESDCKLVECLQAGIENCSDEEIMNAFGPWCHISTGTILTSLVSRRIVEAQLFLYGTYVNSATAFYYVIFDANGGSLAGSAEDILYFQYGTSLDTLELLFLDEVDQYAVKEDSEFCGWQTASHKKLSDRSAVTTNMTVYAMWDEDTSTSTLPAASTLEGFSTGFVDQIIIPSGSTTSSSTTTGTTTQTSSVTTAASYTDLSSSSWYYEAVSYVIEAGLFRGLSDTEFGPEEDMTRSMFVEVLAELADINLSLYGVPSFSDVTAETDGYQAISWATQCGIVTGYNDGTFGPDDPITREQLCVLLNRYLQFMGSVLPTLYEEVTFTDEADISRYAVSSVTACQQAGLISGRTDGSFDPQGTAQRCEVAKVIMQFHQMFY